MKHPVVIAAALIAGSIFLSSVVSAMSTRYSGFRNNDNNIWVFDRFTGHARFCGLSNTRC